MRTACASIVSASAGELADGLALGLQARGGTRRSCGVDAAPLMISAIAHDVCVGREVLPADERGEQVRPGRRGGRPSSGDGRDSTSRRDGRVQLDRVERAADDGVGVRPGREPGVLRATGEHQGRRAAEDLVLELTREPQATDLVGLAVEDQQVEPARLGLRDDGGARWPPRPTRCRARRAGADDRPRAAPARARRRRRCTAGSAGRGWRLLRSRAAPCSWKVLTRRRRASVGILARLVPPGWAGPPSGRRNA